MAYFISNLLENASKTIKCLKNLYTEISKIWEDQYKYNTIGYVPAILNDLQNIDMLLNHDVSLLENMSEGLIKTHNQHVGLVSGIEWHVHEIQKLTRLIHNNVNNIKDKLQEMLNKINKK